MKVFDVGKDSVMSWAGFVNIEIGEVPQTRSLIGWEVTNEGHSLGRGVWIHLLFIRMSWRWAAILAVTAYAFLT